MKVKVIFFVVLALLMALFASPVYADGIPPLPHAFYGNVTINGIQAPVGTIVEARDEGGSVRTGIAGNPITVTTAGQYGSADPLGAKLIVQGNIVDGTTLTFYVSSGGQTAPGGQTPWHSGETTKLDLAATITTPALTAEAGGPYSGTAGASIAISGSASGGTSPYTYAWDLDNNGTYETPGQNTSYSWNNAGTYTIGLKVTDNASVTATDTATVTITEAAPTPTPTPTPAPTPPAPTPPAPTPPAPTPPAPTPPAPTPPAPTPPAPPVPPVPSNNWPLIGGIIGGVIVVVLIIVLVARRRD